MIHRPAEFCPNCKKPLEAIYQDRGKTFVGDTFIGYEPCKCKSEQLPAIQPTCRWVKASERLPEDHKGIICRVGASCFVSAIIDGYFWSGTFSYSPKYVEWLEELPTPPVEAKEEATESKTKNS